MKRSMIAVLLILAGCTTKVEVFDEQPTVPVIWALFNPYDTVQYVRVQRTFIIRDKKDWDTFSQDSLQFRDVEVFLHGRKNGETKWTEQFFETDMVKDDGFFPTENYRIFKLDHPLKINLTYDGTFHPDLDSLILEVRIHDLNLTTRAGAPVLSPGKLIATNSHNILYLYNENPTDFSLIGGTEGQTSSWTNDFTYKQIEFWVHFKEYYQNTVDTKAIHWMTTNGWTENGWYTLTPERILNRIRMLVSKTDSVEARTLDSLDVAITSVSKAFNDYWFFREHWEDTDFKPPWNFDNSYGLFVTYKMGKHTGFTLEQRAMDSLCNGYLYKEMKFRKW